MRKGIFTNKLTINIPKKAFLSGLFVGIIYAIVFYFFLVGCREAWRYLSGLSHGESFIFLSDREIVFYNFFFAFISCLTGFGIATDFWWRTVKVPNYIRLSIIVDQKGLQWFFNHLFFKLAIFFGIFCSGISLFESFQFYPAYRYLFYLLMFVLFFHQWMKARLFFGKKILRYMMIIGVIELSTSLALAFIPLEFSQRMNSVLLKRSPKYYCDYELPTSSIAYGILRKHISFPLYLGVSKQQIDSIILVSYWRDKMRPISMNEIASWISEKRETIYELEYDQMATELYVDKHMKMKEVKKVLMALRKSDARIVYLMANKYGVGLRWTLRPLCEEIHQRDTSYQIPNMPCSEFKALRNEKKVPLELSNNKTLYKNRLIDLEIVDSIKFNIEKFSGGISFEMYVDDESDYETFVRIYESIRVAYLQIWQEVAKAQFGLTLSQKDFDSNNFDSDFLDKIRKIKQEYPVNFIVWSDEEIEYFNLR